MINFEKVKPIYAEKLTNRSRQNYFKSKPAYKIDRESLDIINECYKIVFTDVFKQSIRNSGLTIEQLSNLVSKDYFASRPVVIALCYNSKIADVNVHSLASVSSKDVYFIALLNDTRMPVNETKKDTKVKATKQKIQDEYEIISTLLKPAIEAILEKHGMRLVGSHVEFKNSKALKQEVYKAIFTPLFDELREVGVEVQENCLNNRWNNLTPYTILFNLIGCRLLDGEDDE